MPHTTYKYSLHATNKGHGCQHVNNMELIKHLAYKRIVINILDTFHVHKGNTKLVRMNAYPATQRRSYIDGGRLNSAV